MADTYQNKTSIKYWSEDDRPREKLQNKGRSSLSEAELLAIIIGSGSRNESALDLSKRILIEANNDLNRLAKLNIPELCKFKGIGEAKAINIVAALELGRRRKSALREEKVMVRSSKDSFDYIHGELMDLQHEEFWIILLDRAHQIIKKINISKGGVAGTVTDTRIILKAAIEQLASAIILCHNHPSGNLLPSEADIQLTKKLKEASKTMEINLLDHLIVSNTRYYSFSDEGML